MNKAYLFLKHILMSCAMYVSLQTQGNPSYRQLWFRRVGNDNFPPPSPDLFVIAEPPRKQRRLKTLNWSAFRIIIDGSFTFSTGFPRGNSVTFVAEIWGTRCSLCQGRFLNPLEIKDISPHQIWEKLKIREKLSKGKGK